MVPSMPVPTITPPNTVAASTRYIVGSIPAMPPVLTSGSRSSLPVEMGVEVSTTRADDSSAPPSAASVCAISGWNIQMPARPATEPTARVRAVPCRNSIIPKVMAGMISTFGVILNVERMAVRISLLWLVA